MGRLRHIFSNLKLSSNRQHDGTLQLPLQSDHPPHAIDTLPTLPNPRRPITPVSVDPQLASTFFRLPPELRQQIYRLLISGREIHCDMRYTSTETSIPHSTSGAVFEPDRHWRWRASTCHRHPDAQVISDRCGWGGPPPTACDQFDTPCGIGKETFGLLLCCRLAYREAVQVLYAENTFHINTGALVLYTDLLLPKERSSAITSLIYTCTVETIWDYAPDHLRVKRGAHAYRAIITNIPNAFPSLKRLQVILTNDANMRVLRGQALAVRHPLGDAHMKDILLEPLDSAVGAFRQRLEECVLIMSDGPVISSLRDEIAASAEKVESREDEWEQFWRPLSSDQTDDDSVNTGYWVRMVSLREQRWFVNRLQFDLDQQLLHLDT